jgi:hypothetical protein
VLTYLPLVSKNSLLARIRSAVLANEHSSSRSSGAGALMTTDELVRAAPPSLAPVVRDIHRAGEAYTNSVEVFPILAAAVLMAYALFKPCRSNELLRHWQSSTYSQTAPAFTQCILSCITSLCAPQSHCRRRARSDKRDRLVVCIVAHCILGAEHFAV